MAWARIRHEWDDGTATELEVGTEAAGYPDVMRELVVRVADLWRTTCQSGDET